MLDPVSQSVELAIYSYFAVVAAVGLYLQGQLWRRYRHGDDRADDRPNANG